MCNTEQIAAFEAKWDDYFSFVDTDIQTKLLFEDELYIGYGSHLGLLVEDIKFWYKDAEREHVGYLDGYISHKYGDSYLSDEDIEHFIDKEIENGDLFESNGYWFTN